MLFSVTHFLQHFLERIISDALEEHDRKVNTGGRNTTSLRFVDDREVAADKEQELEVFVASLDNT